MALCEQNMLKFVLKNVLHKRKYYAAIIVLCQHVPKAPVSRKGKGQRTPERFQKYVEASVGERGS